MKGLIIRSDGTHETIELDRDGTSADTITAVVGGWFECYALDSWTDMWGNENAKIDGRCEFNPKATWIFRDAFGYDPRDSSIDFIMGNVLLTGGADDDGNTIGLKDDSLRRYIEWLDEMDSDPLGLPTVNPAILNAYGR